MIESLAHALTVGIRGSKRDTRRAPHNLHWFNKGITCVTHGHLRGPQRTDLVSLAPLWVHSQVFEPYAPVAAGSNAGLLFRGAMCCLCYVWPTQCVTCTLHGVVCDPLLYVACSTYGLPFVGPVLCVACVCVVLHAVRNVVPGVKPSALSLKTFAHIYKGRNKTLCEAVPDRTLAGRGSKKKRFPFATHIWLHISPDAWTPELAPCCTPALHLRAIHAIARVCLLTQS